MKWLFLGSGHGKGIADGVDFTIKRLFDDAMRLSPDDSFKSAEDLVKRIKSDTSIPLYLYNKEDFDLIRAQIPPLPTIKGTSKFHEIIAKIKGQIFEKDKSDEMETLIRTKF